MSTRLGKLVERLGGRLIGNAELEISGIAPLDQASTSQITFLSNPKFRDQAARTSAAALILSDADDKVIGASYSGARIVTDSPYVYFAKAAQFFADEKAIPVVPGIHPSACVDPSAQIAATACIGPQVTVEAGAVIADGAVIDAGCFIGRNAKVGAGTHFFARVVFHSGCEIGARGIIQSGVVIGGDGFGFANEKGRWIKIPQTGRVVIGDDVEIGANTTIDRGAMADTVIEDGVKLDNLIQIGHNCHIGAHTAMAGCVGIAGSARIGKYCTVGGAAMIAGHLTIADRVHVTAGTLVSRSILEPGEYAGFYPFAKKADWEKSAALVRQLTTMREKIRDLEKTVKSLTDKSNE
ncbi:UDP-3-O-(3-hydroxymyristoyl)glucosamine N-acyltransferase [Noviherbaspirillum massiliense]|uniref:UDP-3-O-(3-hydroxymyristoyl)glucosamine N-acyltransferase n=1 Tax=Noviherbaspirillum massiliense TaxID=1465823 RepID=UPI0002D522D4|nr:UDP-3-O-(3-hydroxymyristoyl)glucosamine N-acyltransferase [Noviherbaspirillum massiliense]